MKNKEFVYKELSYYGNFGKFVIDTLLSKNGNIFDAIEETDTIVNELIANTEINRIYDLYKKDIFLLFKNERKELEYIEIYKSTYHSDDFEYELFLYCFRFVTETIRLLLYYI